jgi:hypothetical protein
MDSREREKRDFDEHQKIRQEYNKPKELEVIMLDPVGIEIEKHKILYKAMWGYRLIINVNGNLYHISRDGRHISRIGPEPIPTAEEIEEQKWLEHMFKQNSIKISHPDNKDLRLPPPDIEKLDRGSCSECGEGYDNEEEWRYNTECAVCGYPIPEHLIIKKPE